MRLDIEKGAKLTVQEGDREGLRFVRWRLRADDSVPDAVSRRADSPRTGRDEKPEGNTRPKSSGRKSPPALERLKAFAFEKRPRSEVTS
jgi:hypothetical protein